MLPVDRMRLLDRWLGVPLCWLASAARRLAPTRPRVPPERVVFLQLAESGSNVLADPAVRRWAQAAQAKPGFVTFAPNRASLQITATIDDADVFCLDPTSLFSLARDVWRLRQWLRARAVDTLVDLELFTRASALICLFCATPRRVGFHAPGVTGLYRGELYTDPVRFDFDTHVARNYLALVNALDDGGVAPGLPALARRGSTHDEAERVGALLQRLFADQSGPLVLVNVNASDMLPQRRWPIERFEALIGELLSGAAPIRLLLTGGAEDKRTTAPLAQRIDDPRCVDGAGCFTLVELPALFERAQLLLTNDSGPAHFASVTGVPVVVMFGPETPLRFAPLGNSHVFYADLPCSPCVTPSNQRRSNCDDNRCMKEISVDSVLSRVRAILDGSDASNVVPLRSQTPPPHASADGQEARELAQ